MPSHHNRDRDASHRNRRHRDRNDRFEGRTDADRFEKISGASTSATQESFSDDRGRPQRGLPR